MPVFTHGKATRVLVSNAEMSTFFKDYNYAAKMDTAETSTFGTSTKTYVQGFSDATLSLSGYFDGTAGAVDAVLSAAIGATQDIVVSVSPTGSYAIGARTISGQSVQTDYSVTGGIGSVVEVSAAFQADGTIRSATSIHDLTAETTGTLSTSTDTARLSTQGGLLTVHVTANTMNALSTIKVQTSLDNTTFADYATITVPTTVTGGFSAVISSALTANRFIRATTTYAGTGSLTFQANFIRL